MFGRHKLYCPERNEWWFFENSEPDCVIPAYNDNFKKTTGYGRMDGKAVDMVAISGWTSRKERADERLLDCGFWTTVSTRDAFFHNESNIKSHRPSLNFLKL
jgi:hypothetical protein